MNKALECAREICALVYEGFTAGKEVGYEEKHTAALIQQAITDAKREGFMAGVEAAAVYMDETYPFWSDGDEAGNNNYGDELRQLKQDELIG